MLNYKHRDFQINFCNETNVQNYIQEIKKRRIDLYYFSNIFECLSLYSYTIFIST